MLADDLAGIVVYSSEGSHNNQFSNTSVAPVGRQSCAIDALYSPDSLPLNVKSFGFREEFLPQMSRAEVTALVQAAGVDFRNRSMSTMAHKGKSAGTSL
jgi:hypothetical protein